ncbi:MAG: hypothetical protein V3T64_06140, partial [Myxococcota bacterium]
PTTYVLLPTPYVRRQAPRRPGTSDARDESRRPTNWLLRYRPDGFLINLRHFVNAHLAEDAPTMVWIGSSEVACVRECIHRSKRRDHDGGVSSVVHKYLEIVLHSQDTEQLAAAIEHELRQPPAGRIVRSKVKQADQWG